jgi:AraC-like DNA-binding protein
VDVLTDVLATTRVRGGISGRIEARAPWALHFDGSRPASFHVVVQGACWLRLDGAPEAVQLVQGDVALLPRGAAHVLADATATPPEEFRTLVERHDATTGSTLAVGGGAGSATVLVCGAYDEDADLSIGVLASLPPLVHLRAAQATTGGALPTAVHLLAAEMEAPAPGSEDVVSRLVDVLLVYILRSWQHADPGSCPGWFAALADPLVGAALGAVHADPGRRWTVASLAASVGLSRAAFARRFTDVVGEPPLGYVSRWRMTVAAALLRDTSHPLAVVADRVGYDSEFAFARAFRRAYGLAPGRYRSRARPPAQRTAGAGVGVPASASAASTSSREIPNR